jgi:colanic acid biosynthesis glycosyl transferase WcaI
VKILILTQWFDPEPTLKGLAFARALVQRGHQVEVLTGFPNYPGGKVYHGYKIEAFKREVIHGITVNRVPLFPSHDASSIRRVLNYASFAFSATVFGLFFVSKPDVIYVYQPPATVGLPALVLRKRFGVPVVYDIQDLWPDTLTATGVITNTWVLRCIAVWCRYVYSRVDSLVVLSPGFKTVLSAHGVPESKMEVIYNWSPEPDRGSTETTPDAACLQAMAGRFNVLFAGTMGRAQGLTAVLAAARLVEDSSEEVQFVFIGAGIEREGLELTANQMGLKNTVFLPRQPSTTMGAILDAAQVLLIHLVDDPLFEVTIPSKTQSSLAAGRPILIGVKGSAADLVQRAGAGIVCDPMCPQSIAKGVLDLVSRPESEREAMGQGGKDFYAENLSMSVGVEKFERAFLRAVSSLSDRSEAPSARL